ncbi:MAG TPA: CcoH-like protein [Paenalcaligenes sp.]|nr:CcoH-like protein [Paenalcaligenes sp.]
MGKSMEELDANPNPWYKEPWPWILMSGPAIVAVACIITIYLAFSTGADEDMGGAVRRGLIVEVLQERSPGDAPAAMDVPALQEQEAKEKSSAVSAQPKAGE